MNRFYSWQALNIRWFYINDNSIYVNPEEYTQTEENLAKVSSILLMTVEELKQMTKKRELRYMPIINKLSIDSSEKVKDTIREQNEAISKSILSEESSISRFFILTENPSRYYPENSVGSQIIWFLDNAWVWRYWIEWYFNGILKWNNWKIVARKDVKWRIIDTISLEKDDLIWEWVKIITTIDRNVQQISEQVLSQSQKLEKY